jgi:hypothetical protein
MSDVPLQKAEAEWLRQHLQEKGLIPTSTGIERMIYPRMGM